MPGWLIASRVSGHRSRKTNAGTPDLARHRSDSLALYSLSSRSLAQHIRRVLLEFTFFVLSRSGRRSSTITSRRRTGCGYANIMGEGESQPSRLVLGADDSRILVDSASQSTVEG